MNKLPRQKKSVKNALTGFIFTFGFFISIFLAVFWLSFPFSFIAPVVFIVGSLLLGHQVNKKRIAERELAMRQIATQFGFSYSDKPSSSLVAYLNVIKHNLGDKRFDLNKTKNVMTGRFNSRHVAVFDHTYLVEVGSSTVTERETIFLVISDKLNLPNFQLEEGRGGFLGNAFKDLFPTRDIKFRDRPDFTKKYQLHGGDETTLRRVFTPQIIKFYEDEYPLQTLAGGNLVCIFQPRESEEASSFNEIQTWMNGLIRLHDLLAQVR